MAFFRRNAEKYQSAPQAPTPSHKPTEITVTYLEGHQPLEVKGESYYQDALWIIVREFGREVPAILQPEPENPYDENAVAVMVSGFLVGHLGRTDAALYQPKIVELMQREGRPIAVAGRIFGGEPDKPSLGIWLYHDPEEFGILPPVRRPPITQRDGVLTGESSEGLPWLASLPTDRLTAIRDLRRLLEAETEPIQRHFMFNELEDRLYASREVVTSALLEYEDVCEHHHAEVEPIVLALVAKFGGLPSMPTYRQMAILKQKAHDFAGALMWAERGLSVYGDRYLRVEAVADLRGRTEKMRKKLTTG